MKLFAFLLLISISTFGQIAPETRKLTEEANAAEQKGDYQGAIAKHKKVFELNPTFFRPACTIAGLYGILGLYDEEINWAQKSIKLNPRFAMAYIYLGNAYAGKGNYDQAELTYKQAGQLEPKNAVVPHSLGLVAEYRKNIPMAIKYYEAATKMDPTYENSFFSLAAIYMNQKKYDKAELNIKKVLEIHPDAIDAQELKQQIDQLKKRSK